MILGLLGLAGAGKDTAAAFLVEEKGYVRIAFADALKDMALAVDPLISIPGSYTSRRLSKLVRGYGWERTKRSYPDARGLLQKLGVAVREHNSDYWINAALSQISEDAQHNYVVTDVRFPNEVDALRTRGAELARIERPGIDAGTHISETALADLAVDFTVRNDGSLEELRRGIFAVHEFCERWREVNR